MYTHRTLYSSPDLSKDVTIHAYTYGTCVYIVEDKCYCKISYLSLLQ